MSAFAKGLPEGLRSRLSRNAPKVRPELRVSSAFLNFVILAQLE